MKLIGWIGSFFGLLGSLLLALNTPYSGFGFVLFLFSNMAWLYHSVKSATWSLVAMQVGFTVTSTLGIFNWLT